MTISAKDLRAIKRKNDIEFISGQYHYQNCGNREDLQSDVARMAYDRAKSFAENCKKQ